MARRTKTPIIRDVDGPDPPVDPAAIERPVPPRPAWMQARQGTVGKPPRSRNNRLATQPSAEPKPAGDVTRTAEWTLSERLRNGLRSAAAAGYGVSLLLHLLIMLGMALWVLPQLVKSRSVTTVIQSEDEAPQPLDTLHDVQLELPAGQDNQLLPQLTEATRPQDAPLNLLEHQFLRDVTAAESRGEGGSSGTGGGFRLLEPGNAVKAGSFTAWTIPIAQRFGEEVEAGDDPRPGQDYHIVIQIKVPDDRRVYSISDLSGRVIGTDGYVQVIPAQSYYRDEEGQLLRIRLGHRLPVVDGVVQILVHVPGAEALVKDTIVVKSRRLKEEQTLELVFGRAARNAAP